jgi:hypothetical protein
MGANRATLGNSWATTGNRAFKALLCFSPRAALLHLYRVRSSLALVKTSRQFVRQHLASWCGVALLLAGFAVSLAGDKPEDFRRVDGKLYNIEKSVLWGEVILKPISTVSNGVVAVKMKAVYSTGVPVGAGQIGWRESPSLLGHKPEYEVFIRNCPRLAEGKVTTLRAMKCGTETIKGRVLETWDYGTPNVVSAVVTNTPAALPKPPKGTNAPAKVAR